VTGENPPEAASVVRCFKALVDSLAHASAAPEWCHREFSRRKIFQSWEGALREKGWLHREIGNVWPNQNWLECTV
jgi:hypothetical protein